MERNLNVFRYTLVISVVLAYVLSETVLKPTLDDSETISCDEFSRYARFNPYSVLNDTWIVFYYWGPHMEITTYKFSIPTAVQREKINRRLSGHVSHSLNWTAPHVLMKNHINETMILIQKGNRGEYWVYPFLKAIKKNFSIEPTDMRFKQTGDNKYIGFMYCAKQSAYMMSRIYEIPPQNKLQDVATRFGYRGRGGKSYLYQGHQWMPIPEADENEFYYNKLRVLEGDIGNI